MAIFTGRSPGHDDPPPPILLPPEQTEDIARTIGTAPTTTTAFNPFLILLPILPIYWPGSLKYIPLLYLLVKLFPAVYSIAFTCFAYLADMYTRAGTTYNNNSNNSDSSSSNNAGNNNNSRNTYTTRDSADTAGPTLPPRDRILPLLKLLISAAFDALYALGKLLWKGRSPQELGGTPGQPILSVASSFNDSFDDTGVDKVFVFSLALSPWFKISTTIYHRFVNLITFRGRHSFAACLSIALLTMWLPSYVIYSIFLGGVSITLGLIQYRVSREKTYATVDATSKSNNTETEESIVTLKWMYLRIPTTEDTQGSQPVERATIPTTFRIVQKFWLVRESPDRTKSSHGEIIWSNGPDLRSPRFNIDDSFICDPSYVSSLERGWFISSEKIPFSQIARSVEGNTTKDNSLFLCGHPFSQRFIQAYPAADGSIFRSTVANYISDHIYNNNNKVSLPLEKSSTTVGDRVKKNGTPPTLPKRSTSSFRSATTKAKTISTNGPPIKAASTPSTPTTTTATTTATVSPLDRIAQTAMRILDPHKRNSQLSKEASSSSSETTSAATSTSTSESNSRSHSKTGSVSSLNSLSKGTNSSKLSTATVPALKKDEPIVNASKPHGDVQVYNVSLIDDTRLIGKAIAENKETMMTMDKKKNVASTSIIYPDTPSEENSIISTSESNLSKKINDEKVSEARYLLERVASLEQKISNTDNSISSKSKLTSSSGSLNSTKPKLTLDPSRFYDTPDPTPPGTPPTTSAFLTESGLGNGNTRRSNSSVRDKLNKFESFNSTAGEQQPAKRSTIARDTQLGSQKKSNIEDEDSDDVEEVVEDNEISKLNLNSTEFLLIPKSSVSSTSSTTTKSMNSVMTPKNRESKGASKPEVKEVSPASKISASSVVSPASSTSSLTSSSSSSTSSLSRRPTAAAGSSAKSHNSQNILDKINNVSSKSNTVTKPRENVVLNESATPDEEVVTPSVHHISTQRILNNSAVRSENNVSPPPLHQQVHTHNHHVNSGSHIQQPNGLSVDTTPAPSLDGGYYAEIQKRQQQQQKLIHEDQQRKLHEEQMRLSQQQQQENQMKQQQMYQPAQQINPIYIEKRPTPSSMTPVYYPQQVMTSSPISASPSMTFSTPSASPSTSPAVWAPSPLSNLALASAAFIPSGSNVTGGYINHMMDVGPHRQSQQRNQPQGQSQNQLRQKPFRTSGDGASMMDDDSFADFDAGYGDDDDDYNNDYRRNGGYPDDDDDSESSSIVFDKDVEDNTTYNSQTAASQGLLRSKTFMKMYPKRKKRSSPTKRVSFNEQCEVIWF